MADNRPVDLLAGEADIGVRLFAPSQSDLVAVRIGNVGSGLFASQGYLEEHGSPCSFDDALGEEHSLIGFDRNPWAAGAYQRLDRRLQPGVFAIRSDQIEVQWACARAGIGIVPMQVPLALREPALVRVLPEWELPDLAIWLVVHVEVRASPPVRRVFGCLREGLEAYTAEADARRR